jgi:hypothetical protein
MAIDAKQTGEQSGDTRYGVGSSLDRYPWGSWLARKDSNLRSPDPEDSRRFHRWSVRFERGADWILSIRRAIRLNMPGGVR